MVRVYLSLSLSLLLVNFLERMDNEMLIQICLRQSQKISIGQLFIGNIMISMRDQGNETKLLQKTNWEKIFRSG